MTETQREAVPRDDGGELATTLAFLRFARHCVLKKTDGLGDDDLRRPVVPSGTSLLGLVRHLTDAERHWVGWTFAGTGEDSDVYAFPMTVEPGRTTAEVLDEYRAACDASDATVLAAGDLDAPTARPVDDAPKSLRWVLTHLTTETTRHAGHADVLRELIDGTTGR